MAAARAPETGLGRFVGRQRELARLDQLVAAAADGRPGVALIAASSGMGATRCLDQALARWHAAALPLSLARSDAIPAWRGRPFGPVAVALGSLLSSFDAVTLGALAGPSWDALVPVLPGLARPPRPDPPVPAGARSSAGPPGRTDARGDPGPDHAPRRTDDGGHGHRGPPRGRRGDAGRGGVPRANGPRRAAPARWHVPAGCAGARAPAPCDAGRDRRRATTGRAHRARSAQPFRAWRPRRVDRRRATVGAVTAAGLRTVRGEPAGGRRGIGRTA